jgi:hypothetical protein
MQEQLLVLLRELKTPELCLILEHNAHGSYSWKYFGKPSKMHNLKHHSNVEEAVVNNYLAYLAQMCQSKVFSADGNLVAYNARYVLCPEAFLSYIKHPKKHTISLEKIIESADVVCLKPGIWQNHGKVIEWQARLAVWRKHGRQFEPIVTQEDEHCPSKFNPPPAYSKTDQFSAYAEKYHNDVIV